MADVELTIDKTIATITLNRPDALNALSTNVMSELDAAIGEVDRDADVRGVIVTGAGRAFVAGADIAEISKLDATSGTAFARAGQAVFTRLEKLEKPVIAAVNGFALGGGCELALACHVRFAAENARFGQPEVKLGILPGFGGTQRLPRLVGRGLAAQIILDGQILDAREALRIGLVNRVVAPDELIGECRAWLEEVFANGPRAVAASLAAIRGGLDLDLDAALELEAELFGECCGTAEMVEGTAAFREKRKPQF